MEILIPLGILLLGAFVGAIAGYVYAIISLQRALARQIQNAGQFEVPDLTELVEMLEKETAAIKADTESLPR